MGVGFVEALESVSNDVNGSPESDQKNVGKGEGAAEEMSVGTHPLPLS
jgi:hypothetical protein